MCLENFKEQKGSIYDTYQSVKWRGIGKAWHPYMGNIPMPIDWPINTNEGLVK